jgi:hypothetical protein
VISGDSGIIRDAQNWLNESSRTSQKQDLSGYIEVGEVFDNEMMAGLGATSWQSGLQF